MFAESRALKATLVAMTAPGEPTRFDAMYRDDRMANDLPAATPWDIGGPQPVVQQLVAVGAIRGAVLDPGTGPGHHAIHFASKGLRATGIDASPAAIERARMNATTAGVSVDFELADAIKLEGFDGRFDTVVDSSFYHTLGDDEAVHVAYLHALHRVTRPGARLFVFAFGPHNVNGIGMQPAVPEDNFRRLFPQTGWEITYLGTTTHQVNVSVPAFAAMVERNPQLAGQKPMLERLRVIEGWLERGRVHLPFWEVHASRVD